MQKVDTYTFDGKKKEAVAFPKSYDVKPNLELLSQAVHVYEDRSHFGLAYAKTRSEVAISRKKIYKQKGTGGARHGAKSAPIFVGGGAAHGPKGIKRVLRLSNSQKEKALIFALNYKISDSQVAFVEGLEKVKKTKEAALLIKKIAKDKNWKQGNVLIAISLKNKEFFKFFRNIKGAEVSFFKNLNAYNVYQANTVIIDREAIGEKPESGSKNKESRTGRKSRIGKMEITKEVKKTIKKSRISKTSRIGRKSKISKKGKNK